MASEIASALAQAIGNGLRRKSIVSCSKWAEKFRVMGKPWPGNYSFKYFPWARAMHDCEDEKWVGQKSAQVGYTEVALNRVFYTIDIKRIDCLYLLPSQQPDASNFSAGRFDPALELSPYLATLFSDTNNVGHKRAGSTNLYVRGTHSRSQLKSIPAGLIVFDELDEMVQKNLSLAEERQAGQTAPQQIRISTPTVAGTGINLEYEDSTKEHFYFRCPNCSTSISSPTGNCGGGKWTELIFPDCLVITADSIHDPKLNQSYLRCKECKGVLQHETKCDWLADGNWDRTTAQGRWRGFHINGLYSSAEPRRPSKIAEKVLRSETDQTIEQELYNSVLGMVHEVKGARINDDDLAKCKRDYLIRPKITAGSLITMGVDQGHPIYYEVNQWLPIASPNPSADIHDLNRPKLLDCGTVDEFESLDELMKRWKVNGCVIDGHPEKRLALQFAYRWPGLVYLCFYTESAQGRNFSFWSGEPSLTVDRTAWLDLSLGRIKHNLMLLPGDLPNAYGEHLKAIVRKPEKDKNGNPIARYITGDRVADHFAHTRNYTEIALEIATTINKNESIVSPR